jgi:hypothetical protein
MPKLLVEVSAEEILEAVRAHFKLGDEFKLEIQINNRGAWVKADGSNCAVRVATPDRPWEKTT